MPGGLYGQANADALLILSSPPQGTSGWDVRVLVLPFHDLVRLVDVDLLQHRQGAVQAAHGL